MYILEHLDELIDECNDWINDKERPKNLSLAAVDLHIALLKVKVLLLEEELKIGASDGS